MENETDIMLTIIVPCYNHEKYIGGALDSFLSQKTKYKYEIIIRDDASTDNSQKIISEYAEKYPGIIKPILLSENTYSKGVHVINSDVIDQINGKYLAITEGDDCWIDDNKIEKQLDFLENEPKYSGCSHRHVFFNCDTGKEVIDSQIYKDIDVDVEMIIRGVVSMHTSSVVARSYLAIEYFKIYEELGWDTSDRYMMAYIATKGPIRCFADKMSMYRWHSGPYSFTMTHNREEQIKWEIKLAEDFDKITDFRYHEIIKENIQNSRYEVDGYSMRDILHSEYLRKKLAQYKLKDRFAVLFKISFPNLYKKLANIYHKKN